MNATGHSLRCAGSRGDILGATELGPAATSPALGRQTARKRLTAKPEPRAPTRAPTNTMNSPVSKAA